MYNWTQQYWISWYDNQRITKPCCKYRRAIDITGLYLSNIYDKNVKVPVNKIALQHKNSKYNLISIH